MILEKESTEARRQAGHDQNPALRIWGQSSGGGGAKLWDIRDRLKGPGFFFFFSKRLLVFFYDNVKEIMTVNSYWALITQ